MSDHGKFEIILDREVGHVFHCVCGKWFTTTHDAATHVPESKPADPAPAAPAAAEPAAPAS